MVSQNGQAPVVWPSSSAGSRPPSHEGRSSGRRSIGGGGREGHEGRAPPFGRKDDVKEEKCLHENQRESGAVTVKRPSEGGNGKRNPHRGVRGEC